MAFSPSSHLPIGIFDSGLGGLTVVKELNRLMPKENIIYVGDTARVPYGTKSPKTIQRYAKEISAFLIKKNVKAIVVACNSASSVALPALKQLRVPVIGVIEPGAKGAVAKFEKKRIGVIGTAATINSRAYNRAIKKRSNAATIFAKPCPLFVPLVEEGRTSGPIVKQIAEAYLGIFKKKKVHSLVLGCTHYPLLKPIIKSVMGKKVALVDSASETALAVKELLTRMGQVQLKEKSGKLQFFTTDDPALFARLGFKFLGRRISPVRLLRLESL